MIDGLKLQLTVMADQLEAVKKRNVMLEDECNNLRESRDTELQEARENSSQKSKSEERSLRSENEKMQEKVKRLEKLNERLKEEKVELEFTASSMTKKCDELKNK